MFYGEVFQRARMVEFGYFIGCDIKEINKNPCKGEICRDLF